MVSLTIPKSQNLKTDDLPAQLGFAVTDALGCRVDGLTIPPESYRKLWRFYLQRFDPLVKLLHVPTIQSVVLDTVSKTETADHSILALVYAIAFAATVTLSSSETARQFLLEKTILLRHLMQEMDNAFMKGQFMIRPNTTSLTALVIYLVFRSMLAFPLQELIFF